MTKGIKQNWKTKRVEALGDQKCCQYKLGLCNKPIIFFVFHICQGIYIFACCARYLIVLFCCTCSIHKAIHGQNVLCLETFMICYLNSFLN